MNSPTPKPRSTPKYLNNFRDPVGLARRMLMSCNPAAYWAMAREGLRPLAMPADWMLQRRERKLLAENVALTKPVILLVGPPRAGTTLLYQLLADCLDTTWFPNVSEMFPRAPIAASKIFAWKRKRTTKLRSFYGQTSGLSAPNDAFHIWNRWLGTDRYKPVLRANAEPEMLQFLATWTEAFGKPLVNKNNRNTLCIGMLSRAIPTAHVVVLRREAADIARSLIRAREFVQGDKSDAWGLASRSQNVDDPLGYVTDVCDQIGDIHTQLAEQLVQIDPARLTETTFEELCADPQRVVEKIAFASGVALREPQSASFGHLRIPSSRPLSDAEEARLAEQLDRMRGIVNTPPSINRTHA